MKAVLAALAALVTAGCGSIFHGSTQQISVSSTPPGATARAACSDGSAVEATTPGTLLLRRNAEGCAITVSKAGYVSQTVALTRGKSSAMVGNVPASIASALGGVLVGAVACIRSSSAINTCAVAGGLFGLFLPGYLDARTGAMYTQRPDHVDVALKPTSPP